MRCSGKSMISQLYSADRGALQRALQVRSQRHACVQGGASSLGCGVTMTARTGSSRHVRWRASRGSRDLATNVYGSYFVRLNLTGFGFQANLVEEHVLFSAFLHDSVSLERTWTQKLFPGLMSGQLKLAITGLKLLTTFTIHLFLFRFTDTEPRTLRSPPTLTTWYSSWLITLKFFWTDIIHVPLVPDREIFVNGFKVLKNPVWGGFYIMMVVFFVTHAAEFDNDPPFRCR